MPLSRCVFAWMIISGLLTASCGGQRTAANQPLTEKQQEQFVSYWTNESNWHSELQLRNTMPSKELLVTPSVISPDGREFALKEVKIKPQQVVNVDLSTAVASAAPSLVGGYGSLILRYDSGSMRSLYAAVMVHRMGRSIAFHIDAMDNLDSVAQVGRQGIWWLPNAQVKDYLVLSNQSVKPIPLKLTVYSQSEKPYVTDLTLSSREMRRLSIRALVDSGGLSGSFGGISIMPTSNGQALDSLHVAFDEQVGFSAALKMFDYDPGATIGDRDHNRSGVWTLRAPMLALAHPDPELAFPPSTLLHPMLFVRNITSHSQTVELDFAWRADEEAKGYVKGPRFELGPLETRLVQIDELKPDQAPPLSAHWSSVYLRTSAKPDEIVAVAASYDDTLRYGAQTPFIDQLSFLWKGGQFEFDENHNSLITVGNDSSSKTTTLFTLFYDDAKAQQHSYQLEQEVGPHDQMWINIGQLVQNRVPDRNGVILPGDLKRGSYEFRDETHPGNGRLFEGKVIYDTSYGHVSYGCAACCGTSQARVTFNPFGIPVTTQAQNQVQISDYCNSPWTDDSGDFYNWSVANTSIAQTTNTGMHTGLNVGQTSSVTRGTVQGTPNRYTCPLRTFSPSGPTNTQPRFVVNYSAYIPVDHVQSPDGCTYQGNSVNYTYIGDANRGTARAAEFITVVPDKKQVYAYGATQGQTRQYGYGSPANGSTLSAADEDNLSGDCHLYNGALTGTPTGNHDETWAVSQGQEHMSGNASDPFYSVGAVTWDLRVVLNDPTPAAPTGYVNYNFTCYPAHQVVVNGQLLYRYTPPSNDKAYLFGCLALSPSYSKVSGQTSEVAIPAQ